MFNGYNQDSYYDENNLRQLQQFQMQQMQMNNGQFYPFQFMQNGGQGHPQNPGFANQVVYNHNSQMQSSDSVPQTPFDLNYGASMLPRNLLITSPFVGSPMTAMSPGNFPQSKFVPITGPAPPKLQAPPKARKKSLRKSALNNENSAVSSSAGADSKNANTSAVSSEDSEESEDEVIITERLIESENAEPMSHKVITIKNLNTKVKVFDFLNYLKFGPIQFCRASGPEALELKFVYEKTHDNFLSFFLINKQDFVHEFESPKIEYQLSNYEPENAIELQQQVYVENATRSVKITKFEKFPLLNDDYENLEKKLRLKYGEIDLINTNEDRHVMMIHFEDLASAVKLVQDLDNTKYVCYIPDRCGQLNDDSAELIGSIRTQNITVPMQDMAQSFQSLAMAPKINAGVGAVAGPEMYPMIQNLNAAENRTVYLGNLASKTTVEEVCNVVRGGILQHIKLISEKHICFITFISAASATQFYTTSNLNGLTIHNKKIKVGWGKNPGELPNSIALAVTVGASRNVYIGVKDEQESGNFNANVPRVVPDEKTLRKDFSRWGDIEQINFFRDGYCAFVNFMNISSAIKAIDEFHGNSEIHAQLQNRYVHYKINYAKDRCGNPPKFVGKQKKKKKDEETPKKAKEPLTEQQTIALASIGISADRKDDKREKRDKGEKVESQKAERSDKSERNEPEKEQKSKGYNKPQAPTAVPQGTALGYRSSGSQVMAQYLARAQLDSYMYQDR